MLKFYYSGMVPTSYGNIDKCSKYSVNLKYVGCMKEIENDSYFWLCHPIGLRYSGRGKILDKNGFGRLDDNSVLIKFKTHKQMVYYLKYTALPFMLAFIRFKFYIFNLAQCLCCPLKIISHRKWALLCF